MVGGLSLLSIFIYLSLLWRLFCAFCVHREAAVARTFRRRVYDDSNGPLPRREREGPEEKGRNGFSLLLRYIVI